MNKTMLSDEEKISLNRMKLFARGSDLSVVSAKDMNIILNLIERQSKEIEELKEDRKKYPIAMNDEQYKKVIELAQKDIKDKLDRQINVRTINEENIEKIISAKTK